MRDSTVPPPARGTALRGALDARTAAAARAEEDAAGRAVTFPPGGPRKFIDIVQVIALAAQLSTMKDIASEVGVGVETLKRRFGDDIAKARAITLNSLRAKQVQMALDGNERMLIHLGRAEARQAYAEPKYATPHDDDAVEFDGDFIMSATGRGQIAVIAQGEVVEEEDEDEGPRRLPPGRPSE